MVSASNLSELADKISKRAISTLELISDRDFEAGLRALSRAAASAGTAPVVSPHELLVFERSA